MLDERALLFDLKFMLAHNEHLLELKLLLLHNSFFLNKSSLVHILSCLSKNTLFQILGINVSPSSKVHRFSSK